MEQGLRFKAMYASLGLTVDDVANFLQVSSRTVQLWISGRVRIPHAAYKLLRLQLRYELPGEAWNGWHISAGRLYTPEGFDLNPQDFSWWSLLVRRAAMFSVCYSELVKRRLVGRTAPVPGGTRLRGAPAPAGSVPATVRKSLSSNTPCRKVGSRCLVGVQEASFEAPPMVITGRPSRCSTI